MYAYIKGTLTYCGNGFVVLEAGGIGYKIFTPLNVIASLPSIGSQVQLFTYFSVREDAMELFGFLSQEALSMYELLISVSGVGPKVGLAILSTLEPHQFAVAVASGDAKSITKAPGVGPKLAQRIILELKDKLTKMNEGVLPEEIVSPLANDTANEAVEALCVLGYSQSEAQQAVVGLSGSLEEIVGQALKNLMRR